MSSSVSTELGPNAGLPNGRPKPSLRRRLVFLSLGVVLATGLGVGLFTSSGTGNKSGPPAAGDQVPTFSLSALGGGGSVHVDAGGGALNGGSGGGRQGGDRGDRPAVLLFFASWCTQCWNEVPTIAHVYTHQQASGSRLTAVRVVGIDGNDPTPNALSFVHRDHVTFPVGVDNDYAVTQGKFRFTGLPDAVFVKPDGTIAGVHYGALSGSSFTGWERRLLASRAS